MTEKKNPEILHISLLSFAFLWTVHNDFFDVNISADITITRSL